MILSLAGYMGSGKSRTAKILSENTGFRLIDLDREISLRHEMSIPEIFKNHGEIFFRKKERELLEELLDSDENTILSLGGGTPAYYDNMELINEKSESFYLQTGVSKLVERLSRQKAKRPLIANIDDADLPEFIAKHLFERAPYYNRAKFTVNTDTKSAEEVAAEITLLANL